MGLKLHEDWGSTPAAIDNCLVVGDKHDVQVRIIANLQCLQLSKFMQNKMYVQVVH